MTEKATRISPGDIVRVVKLPKYWGAADIRGSVAMVVEIVVADRYCVVRTDSGSWTVATSGLEVISGCNPDDGQELLD